MLPRLLLSFLLLNAAACSEGPVEVLEPPGPGPFPVASTNLEIAPAFADIGDDAMHAYLLGQADAAGEPRYLGDILKYPGAAWTTQVAVPDDEATYGPASGLTLPVVSFITFPSSHPAATPYAFPYHDARYGVFSHMLASGESPRLADPEQRYPLVLLAHGAAAHGLYDVRHAEQLASHGYIVATLNYGDDRTLVAGDVNLHTGALRPLMTSAVLDSLLTSEEFGAHIDRDNIGMTGHSFGGFTALATMGGRYLENPASVVDGRVKAATIAAPWTGGRDAGTEILPFGPGHRALQAVTGPILCLYGTRDEMTLASYILPAVRQLAGPTYVVELLDQPHIFDDGSWQDRDNWELLFFAAYLKNDAGALARLRTGHSMGGGNADLQRFDYQVP